MSHASERLRWRRSAYCGTGACVEWAADGAVVHVRDAKDPAGATIAVARPSWGAFVAAIRAGNLDRSTT
jgi:hypothetical protein